MTRKPAKSSRISNDGRRTIRRLAASALSAERARPAAPEIDADDAPAWTDEQLARAELAEGGKVLRPAAGMLKRGPGRPRLLRTKTQVSVRLDPDVLEALRKDGPGWQARMNETLRKALKISG